MRADSHGGTWPPCRGRLAMPVRLAVTRAMVALLLLTSATRLRHLAMVFGEHFCRRDARHRDLQLVLQPSHHVGLAQHHGVETDPGDLGRVRFVFLRSYL